jgi:hypothetical protein
MKLNKAIRKADKASAKHNKEMKKNRKIFSTWVSAKTYKKSERAAKKLKRQENKIENAYYAYTAAIKGIVQSN